MKTHNVDMTTMTTSTVDLTIELRSANGSSTEFYQADEERVREALRLLAAPQLFAQRHLLLTSQQSASMIPCKGIDMILALTSARMPLEFGLINTANITRASAWPKPEALPGIALPLALRRRTPAGRHEFQSALNERY